MYYLEDSLLNRSGYLCIWKDDNNDTITRVRILYDNTKSITNPHEVTLSKDQWKPFCNSAFKSEDIDVVIAEASLRILMM